MRDVAIALITTPTHALITQRRLDDSFPLHWEFPGGTCETGESLEQCVVREMQEELEILVAVEGRGPEVTHRYPDQTIRLVSFWCRLQSGAPRALEAAAWRWVTARELPQFQFPPASGPLIRAVMERLRQVVA